MKGIVLLWALMFTGFAVAQEGKSNAFDMYELGKRVYTMGSDSCLSCHGADGAGTDRSDVDLRAPSSWKSVMYENALRSQDLDVAMGSVTKAIIALGARDWNEENFTIFQTHWNGIADDSGATVQSAEPFDEEMVGLNGPSRKSHENFVRRGFRKAGLPRPSSKQIEDTMAAAVLTYVTREFSSK
jgi:hypothetical protein